LSVAIRIFITTLGDGQIMVHTADNTEANTNAAYVARTMLATVEGVFANGKPVLIDLPKPLSTITAKEAP
jgi:hypothetical protein